MDNRRDGCAFERDSWGVNAVREAIAEVPETTPLRRILLAIVESIVSASTVDIHAVAPRLMAYGQSLEYDARWALAADIYETVVAHADPVCDADLVVSAFLQLASLLAECSTSLIEPRSRIKRRARRARRRRYDRRPRAAESATPRSRSLAATCRKLRRFFDETDRARADQRLR